MPDLRLHQFRKIIDFEEPRKVQPFRTQNIFRIDAHQVRPGHIHPAVFQHIFLVGYVRHVLILQPVGGTLHFIDRPAGTFLPKQIHRAVQSLI